MWVVVASQATYLPLAQGTRFAPCGLLKAPCSLSVKMQPWDEVVSCVNLSKILEGAGYGGGQDNQRVSEKIERFSRSVVHPPTPQSTPIEAYLRHMRTPDLSANSIQSVNSL